MGQPIHYALRSCLVAVHLAGLLGAAEEDQADAYYLALLRYAGCTADAEIAAAVFGDESATRGKLADLDFSDSTAVMLGVIRRLGEDEPPLTRSRTVMRALLGMPRLYHTGEAHCEVAQYMAGRMGMPGRLQVALGHIFERWDGKGIPHHLKGEAVALSARIVALAQDVVTHHRLGGIEAATAMVELRSGKTYDPSIAACFLRNAADLLEVASAEAVWRTALVAEPGEHCYLEGTGLESALHAMADFIDLKSPYLRGHSPGVARLAAAAGEHCHLTPPEVADLHLAGLVHDIGRVSVSAGVWGKNGALTEEDWERVRLHPYHTERIVGRWENLQDIAETAALHHERLDGSGYHRRLPGLMLSLSARLLAAADVYQALTEPRPHRPAMNPSEAERELRREVKAGRLDATAADAVLAAAGHRIRRQRRPGPAGLSERELEVLSLLARGLSNRDIARRLMISRATVDHHIRHIYNKVGVSTRAAATIFALQHELILDTPLPRA